MTCLAAGKTARRGIEVKVKLFASGFDISPIKRQNYIRCQELDRVLGYLRFGNFAIDIISPPKIFDIVSYRAYCYVHRLIDLPVALSFHK